MDKIADLGYEETSSSARINICISAGLGRSLFIRGYCGKKMDIFLYFSIFFI